MMEDDKSKDVNDINDDSEEKVVDEAFDDDFDENVSKSRWDKIRTNAKVILGTAVNKAGDLTHRGRAEMEIAQLKLKLRNTYAKLGELVFRLKEGEECQNILDEDDVNLLFDQIKSLLGELEAEKQNIQNLKNKEFEGA